MQDGDGSHHAGVGSSPGRPADPEARRQRLQRYVTWTAEDLAELNVALRAQRVQDEPSKARTARLGGSGAGLWGPRKRTPGAWGAAPSEVRTSRSD